VTTPSRLLPGALAFAAVGWTAAVSGGYFPDSWGWPTLVFLLLAACAAVVGERLVLRRLDVVLLAALAGLTAWTAVSALWAPSAGLAVEGAQLDLLYLAAAAAFLVVAPRRVQTMAVGVLAASVVVAAWALTERLFPDWVGSYDPTSGGYLLNGPIGYSNALGLLTALAAIVALGLVATAESRTLRVAAGASLVLLLPTLYFTFGRGAAGALVLGLAVAAALDPRRLRFSVVLITMLPLPLIGVWLASRSAPLTAVGFPRSAAAHDGHQLALELGGLALLQAAVVAALARRIAVSERLRRAYLGVLAAGAAALLVLALVHIGNPATFVARATDSFKSDNAPTGGHLGSRFVRLTSDNRSNYWRIAWHEVRDHPVLGGGANEFRRYWLRYRPVAFGTLNAHNLYLETLADLGPVGLLLLLGALAIPLVAAVRARTQPLVAPVAGAYAAFLGAAALDWDWQLPAVTLAALACGTALVAAARPEGSARPTGRRLRVAAVALAIPVAAFVFAAQIGTGALTASDRAAARDDERAAASEARRAETWLPWSTAGTQLLGEAQLASGDLETARRTFLGAIARDRSDWSLWLDLGLTEGGSARAHALAEARSLNSLSPELAALKP
jgi:O-Antigen ligase